MLFFYHKGVSILKQDHACFPYSNLKAFVSCFVASNCGTILCIDNRDDNFVALLKIIYHNIQTIILTTFWSSQIYYSMLLLYVIFMIYIFFLYYFVFLYFIVKLLFYFFMILFCCYIYYSSGTWNVYCLVTSGSTGKLLGKLFG